MTALELMALAGPTPGGPIKVDGRVVGRAQRLGSRTEFRDQQDRLVGAIVHQSGGKAVVMDPGGRIVARIGN